MAPDNEKTELLVGRLLGEEAGHENPIVRRGHESVECRLETLNGAVHTILFAGGDFEVRIGEKFDPSQRVLSGNVNSRTSRYEGGD